MHKYYFSFGRIDTQISYFICLFHVQYKDFSFFAVLMLIHVCFQHSAWNLDAAYPL